jgi:predicted Zn-dependent peptidase
MKKDMVEDQEFRSKAPEAGPAPKIQLGEFNEFELDNGLRVIVVENYKIPRVSYRLFIDNDPILQKDKVGYVSMAGDLMSRGTKNRTKDEIDAEIDFIGASFSSSSSGLFGSSLVKHQDKLLDVMADVLYNPVFPEEEFEKLRTQTISGLQVAKEDPNSISANVAGIVNYGADHPYGEIQTEETVDNISLDDCKAYYERFFRPNNAYLVVVGAISANDAKMKAQEYFGKWEKGDVPSYKYEVPATPENTNVFFVHKDGAAQSVIRVTNPLQLKPGAPDAIPASIMNSILGGGVFSGYLMQNLRENNAYT